jgi:hypothetical protein
MAKQTAAEIHQKLLDEARKALQASGATIESLTSEQRGALKREYGYAFSFINSDPELRKLFTKAVRLGYTPARFEVELKLTNWYKQRTASQREYDTLAGTPSNLKDLQLTESNIADAIKRQAMEFGGVTVSDADAMALAKQVARDHLRDWEAFLPDIVKSTYITDDVLSFGGQAATTLTQLRDYARSMGVTIPDSTLGDYVDGIFAGTNNMENIQASIQKSVAAQFPQFSDRINAGESLESIVSPYRNMIASYLEIDPNQIGFGFGTDMAADPLLNRALFGQSNQPMPLYDLERAIKQDSRWQKTTNARREYANLTTGLLRKLGVGL